MTTAVEWDVKHQIDWVNKQAQRKSQYLVYAAAIFKVQSFFNRNMRKRINYFMNMHALHFYNVLFLMFKDVRCQ